MNVSDEPYKVPEGHTLDIEHEIVGNVSHTIVKVRRPDGTIEREFTAIASQPTWDD
jgi:hypothetical protein